MTDDLHEGHSWSDESRSTSDIAGRAEFADAVASRIKLCTLGQGSTVFGLVGAWGSGKTTLLHEVVGHLDEWEVVWFSPWSVADVSAVTDEFVSALSEAFPSGSDIRRKLANYSRFGAPALKLIPVMGDAIASATEGMLAEVAKRPAWHTEFANLSKEIAGQGKQVLVVVDDVDRLDGDELRSLLRVVRLLGRFTNVHYLMAYDQATIEGVLRKTGMGGGSSEFMEKIVQYPFEVPPTPFVVRRRWSRAILDAVSSSDASVGGSYVEQRERLLSALATGLETPRAADRLREQIFSLATLIGAAEVDVLDFTALTWLRIAHHRVWDDIRLNPDFYLSWSPNDSDEKRTARLDHVEGLVTHGVVGPVIEIINLLFEPLDIAQALAGRKWRIHSRRYFDRYFHVGIADDDVSERLVESALEDLANNESATSATRAIADIVTGSDEERSSLALDFAAKYRAQSSGTSDALINFASELRTAIELASGTRAIRYGIVDQWMHREVFLALEQGLYSSAELLERFGYSVMLSSAYVMKRSRSEDKPALQRLYLEFAQAWIHEMSHSSFDSLLQREELLSMTNFCIWMRDVKDFRGFLAVHAVDQLALLRLATQFIYANAWTGHGVEYDIVFRTEEFRFAVGDSIDGSLVEGIPEVPAVADYDVADRASPDLTDAQKIDFATRSLRRIYLADDGAHPTGDHDL
jgi:hypothetical protein